jgi:haloalkane dehalogenase
MRVPRSDDKDDALVVADALLDALDRDSRPTLTLWGHCDLILGLAVGQRLAARIGHDIDHVIPDAGHSLQEDQGPMVGELIAGWLRSGA